MPWRSSSLRRPLTVFGYSKGSGLVEQYCWRQIVEVASGMLRPAGDLGPMMPLAELRESESKLIPLPEEY